MTGQFDDPVECNPLHVNIHTSVDEDDGDDHLKSDDDFVAAMRAKMMLLDQDRRQHQHRPISQHDSSADGSTHIVQINGAKDEEQMYNYNTNEEYDEYYHEGEEDDDDDDYLLDDDELLTTKSTLSSSSSMQKHLTESTSLINLNSKSSSSALSSMSHAVSNQKHKMQNLSLSKSSSHTGRDDRATSEQCLDPRTRLILFRMLSSGFLELIDGCLSTGKEANVYYAKAGRIASAAAGDVENATTTTREVSSVRGSNSSNNFTSSNSISSTSTSNYANITFAPLTSPDITEYAIKIYKTSILVFKDRDKYVSGEHRWRKGYCKC